MTSYTPPHNKILWFVIFSFLLICSMIQSSLSCHWEPNVIRCKIICLSYYNQFTISFQECIQTNKINIGAILCAVICILIHPFSTSFWRIIHPMIHSFLLIKQRTMLFQNWKRGIKSGQEAALTTKIWFLLGWQMNRDIWPMQGRSLPMKARSDGQEYSAQGGMV